MTRQTPRLDSMRNAVVPLVAYGLQPILLVGSLAIWFLLGQTRDALLVVLLISQVVLYVCERWFPAHDQWAQRPGEQVSVATVSFLGFIGLGVVAGLADLVLSDGLWAVRQRLGVTVWPDQWPIVAQILLVYFSSEFIYYWIHRGIHRHQIWWRLGGHGFHHSYHNLHAINFITSHPFELVFLAVPSVVVSHLLGAPPAASLGALILLTVNGGVAHANIGMNSRLIGLLFTTSSQHVRHHSAVYEHSNSNYSCNAIVWDRVFGTYAAGDVSQTGIGPKEPTLVEKLLLPAREPDYSRVAPSG